MGHYLLITNTCLRRHRAVQSLACVSTLDIHVLCLPLESNTIFLQELSQSPFLLGIDIQLGHPKVLTRAFIQNLHALIPDRPLPMKAALLHVTPLSTIPP